MHFFYILSAIFIGIFFILLSVGVFLIEAFETLKIDALNFILKDNLFLPLFGFMSLFVGIAVIFYLYYSLKTRYHIVQSSKGGYCLEENVFEDSLNLYWKELFPDHAIQTQVILKKNDLKIIVNLPFVPLDQQNDLLLKVDSDLKNLLQNQIGYFKPYAVSISFK